MTDNNEFYPVLPLKNTVIYPQLVVPLAVGRDRSMAAVDAAMHQSGEEKLIICVAQRQGDVEEPGLDDLHEIGTLAVIRRIERGEHGAQVLVQGICRVRLGTVTESQPALVAACERLPAIAGTTTETEALHRENLDLARRISELFDEQNGPRMFSQLVASLKDPVVQMYRIASLASLDIEREQDVLNADAMTELMTRMHEILQHELNVIELRSEIQRKARGDIERAQREQMLRQQKQAIENALGEGSPEEAEAAELRERLEALELPEAVLTEAERELKRMERMSVNSADYQVARAYLELIIELPWNETTEDQLDLVNAQQILDEDHFGLEDVKERILEFLSVMQLNPESKAPILCFVGPPGVGKTSLGKSISRAIGRKFERLALGGLHDEAELRGHRRTYIGAMPGRILQAVRRAGVCNPLLMLDEIDKLGRDFRGDPSAALMEILDPAQNAEFRDNYLNLPFDLSKVLFITTANSLDSIPAPLLDRMEVLELSGYSDREKREIAQRYLLPRNRREAGLAPEHLDIDAATLDTLVHEYTREAGVRNLDRVIARLARKTARRVIEASPTPPVDADELRRMLGPQRYFPERMRKDLPAGVAPGLAWTEAGGDVLYIEANLVHKEDKVQLTGQLGEVMQESAKIARSLLWHIAPQFGLDRAAIQTNGIHVHVPAGAVPKDGPSAGITMTTALASAYTGTPARSDMAMTGEVTLTGLVLPVGGIREKVLAAHRAGMKHVILPAENNHDLEKLPDHVKSSMTFHPVERIEQVLHLTLPALAPLSGAGTWG